MKLETPGVVRSQRGGQFTPDTGAKRPPSPGATVLGSWVKSALRNWSPEATVFPVKYSVTFFRKVHGSVWRMPVLFQQRGAPVETRGSIPTGSLSTTATVHKTTPW